MKKSFIVILLFTFSALHTQAQTKTNRHDSQKEMTDLISSWTLCIAADSISFKEDDVQLFYGKYKVSLTRDQYTKYLIRIANNESIDLKRRIRNL